MTEEHYYIKTTGTVRGHENTQKHTIHMTMEHKMGKLNKNECRHRPKLLGTQAQWVKMA